MFKYSRRLSGDACKTNSCHNVWHTSHSKMHGLFASPPASNDRTQIVSLLSQPRFLIGPLGAWRWLPVRIASFLAQSPLQVLSCSRFLTMWAKYVQFIERHCDNVRPGRRILSNCMSRYSFLERRCEKVWPGQWILAKCMNRYSFLERRCENVCPRQRILARSTKRLCFRERRPKEVGEDVQIATSSWKTLLLTKRKEYIFI